MGISIGDIELATQAELNELLNSLSGIGETLSGALGNVNNILEQIQNFVLKTDFQTLLNNFTQTVNQISGIHEDLNAAILNIEALQGQISNYTLKADFEVLSETISNIVSYVAVQTSKKQLATWSLTSLIENISAEFSLTVSAHSLYLNRYAVFVDETNVSGILPVTSNFTTTPLIFETDRLSIRFYDERTYQDTGATHTLVGRLEKTFDLNGVKFGTIQFLTEVSQNG